VKQMVERTARYIASVQAEDGAIPWFHGGILDPWDHVEAAMGLSVGGHLREAEAAYVWLARHQLPDGSWMAAYKGDDVVDGTRAETNFVAYVATGVWHHYRISRNHAFAADMWPMVKRAIDFVLSLQAPTGEIYWALDTRTGINKDALVTGCSSICKSIDCAVALSRLVAPDDSSVRHWCKARVHIIHALRHNPERFDRTWESKERYSMDWFYPVMTGVINATHARTRLDVRWEEFVEPELGCRCVSNQPWVTVAETCELTLACIVSRREDDAHRLFDDIRRFQAEDGSWWTGYAFEDGILWPDERPTWTAGAVMLAADALFQLTPASDFFGPGI